MGEDEQSRRAALEVVRDSRILSYALGSLTGVAGLFLILGPERSAETIAVIAGVLIAVVGLTEALEALTGKRRAPGSSLLLLRGFINVATGALLVFWPSITLGLLVWVLGLGLVASGVVGVLAARQLPREAGRSEVVARSVVGAAFGGVLMAWPGRTITVVLTLTGILLLVLGLFLLFTGWRLSRAAAVAAAELDR